MRVHHPDYHVTDYDADNVPFYPADPYEDVDLHTNVIDVGDFAGDHGFHSVNSSLHTEDADELEDHILTVAGVDDHIIVIGDNRTAYSGDSMHSVDHSDHHVGDNVIATSNTTGEDKGSNNANDVVVTGSESTSDGSVAADHSKEGVVDDLESVVGSKGSAVGSTETADNGHDSAHVDVIEAAADNAEGDIHKVGPEADDSTYYYDDDVSESGDDHDEAETADVDTDEAASGIAEDDAVLDQPLADLEAQVVNGDQEETGPGASEAEVTMLKILFLGSIFRF
jgi:hypothetical protein